RRPAALGAPCPSYLARVPVRPDARNRNVQNGRPERPRPEQPGPERPRPEPLRPEQPSPEQPRPGQPPPEQPCPERPGPNRSGAEPFAQSPTLGWGRNHPPPIIIVAANPVRAQPVLCNKSATLHPQPSGPDGVTVLTGSRRRPD